MILEPVTSVVCLGVEVESLEPQEHLPPPQGDQAGEVLRWDHGSTGPESEIPVYLSHAMTKVGRSNVTVIQST